MLPAKKPYSKEHIKKYALNYLNKFGTSKNYLVKFLVNKIKSRFIVSDSIVLQSETEQIVEELSKLGFLNDIAFCESRIRSLLKDGNSIFNITIRLKEKNISQENIDAAFNHILAAASIEEANMAELEEYALLRYAKKRNVLLWQQTNFNKDTDKPKVITTLARKGFSFSLLENLVAESNHLNYCQESFTNHIIAVENKYNL